MSELVLGGCTTEPLMGYLKALGVLRLVSEQADPDARGSWRDGVFVLETKLDRDGLVKFFQDEYKPTPIVAPWAGGSGFFGADNRTAVDAIADSRSDRLAEFAALIRDVRDILARLRITSKPADETKQQLIREYRRSLPDNFVAWMDAALVVQAAGQAFPPLLGTGGNDGRLDFTQNYMQRITALGLPAGALVPAADRWLRQTLFAESASGLLTAAVGQFDPGRAGGPNATTGLEGAALVNPWDFVLMLEGSLLLGGAVARRMGAGQRDRAAFPFTVRAASVGYGSGSDAEEADSRGEIWLPAWSSPTSEPELRLVFAEGRAEYNGRQSRDGIDFARSVASLGVDRGFTAFTRYGFLKRSGKAFVAAPLGTFPVRERRAVDLLREADGWLERFRRACLGDEVPTRFRVARRRVEAAIFDLCRYATDSDNAGWIQAVLRALGAAERELSVGTFAQKPMKGASRPRISPLTGLSAGWLTATDDDSPEFHLARGVAFLNPGTKGTGPVRRYLEPVEQKGKFWAWGERGGHVVWGGGDIARNLGAVLVRRLMDAEKNGESVPPLRSLFRPRLDDISMFLRGETDNRKLEDLVWGLSLIDYRQARELVRREAGQGRRQETEPRRGQSRPPLSRAYALAKLTLLGAPIGWQGQGNEVRRLRIKHRNDAIPGVVVKPEPAIPALLRAGNTSGACEVAARRLRASGFMPLRGSLPDGDRRELDGTFGSVSPDRVLAALLFPIPGSAVDYLADLVLRRPSAETLV